VNTKEQVGAVLSSVGATTLGALVFWSLSGVRVLRADFRAGLESIGLDAAMAADPTPKGALGKAMPAIMVGKRGVFARKAPGGGLAIVVEQAMDGALQHVHVATASTRGGQLGIERKAPDADELLVAAGHPGLLVELEETYRTVRDYLGTVDLSEILSSAMNGSPHRGLFAALSLRERTGGLYFVPAAGVPRMAQLAELIHQVAPECQISVMTITGDQANLAQAAQAARSTFAAQLAELRTELLSFGAKLEADGKQPGTHSITVRAERFRELQARVQVFRDVLGDVAAELDGQIVAVRTELLGKLEAM
jgi:hypothetical protein